jgi:DNA-binding transcriptional ArsR family regulator
VAARGKKSTKPESRVVSDPRAIRALAHPARLAVLDALSFEDTELTATECAKIAGVSPSAMSYHLRALEKWGFVVRAETNGDGRERPWRAASTSWSIEDIADSATATATSALASVTLNRLAAELGAWFRVENDAPKEWRDNSGLDNTQLWLTAEELSELRATQRAWVDAHRGRTAKDHPEGARRVRVTHIVVPTHAEPPTH